MRYVLVGLLGLSGLTVQAQVEANHAVGFSMYFSGVNAAPAVAYSPRVTFPLTFDISLNLTVHSAIGVSGASGTSGSVLLADIPVAAEVAIGHASSSGAYSNIGFFLGGGMGYLRMGVEDENGVQRLSKGIGPLISGGFRLFPGKRSLNTRFIYFFPSDPMVSKAFSVGISYNFGDW